MTSGRNVDRTAALMRSTAASPASMSTPAPAYVSPTRVNEVDARQLVVDPGLGDRDGVVARQAGGAEPGADHTRGRHQPVQVQVGQGVTAEVVPHLGQGEVGGDQLAPGTGVHAEVARPA